MRGSRYAPQDRALVVADYQRGIHYEEISRRRDIPKSTVRRWVAQWADLNAKEDDPVIKDDNYRIAHLAGEVLINSLSHILELPAADQVKYMHQANFSRGTAIDKIQRSHDQGDGARSLTFVIVKQEVHEIGDDAPTIDAELRQSGEQLRRCLPPARAVVKGRLHSS